MKTISFSVIGILFRSCSGFKRLYNKPATERVQAIADILRFALYAFAVYQAISLHTCVLS